MTYQECIYKGKKVMITGIISRSGKLHSHVTRYVGSICRVLGDAKNGMLLLHVPIGRFHPTFRKISVPAGCVTLISEIKQAKKPQE